MAKDTPAVFDKSFLAPIVRTRQDSGDKIPVPSFLKNRTMREAPGLSPTVDWRRAKVGQGVVGRWLGFRGEVGPYKSNLYDLADLQTGEIFGVWGGIVLDRKVSSIDPQKGDLVLVQFLGELAAKPGQNPARDFRVAIIDEPHPQ